MQHAIDYRHNISIFFDLHPLQQLWKKRVEGKIQEVRVRIVMTDSDRERCRCRCMTAVRFIMCLYSLVSAVRFRQLVVV